ncbi:aminoacyl-histidine dipeptidase [Arenibacter sp. GZD96]|uniref:aminoacyl-histidine dipeptidase n=1 Tax=Aurantibrevibacter litoralis TaxID=3106030 RepID=UPI002AFF0BEC|nr:aminoacyl-histidine dipeptidase [Arenibacter sp. GZD-96]MEA1785090.1 aminoacyl-histidine dipeptidase [Arenibacter sp. GZD-96]
MSVQIQNLEPKEVWQKFADLNAVPRASKKEERIIQFVMEFGTSLKLETLKDDVGNVIIRKPGTAGMKNRKTVTLQSHLDMVHQKNKDSDFDFDTQGIPMYVDGDWVKAKETTLGADNGLGVAAIMALLESTTIPHPPLEALFTVDEETGMTGAMGLQPDLLKGEILLNLDTEEDDEIAIGCAGGIDVTATKEYNEKDLPRAVVGYEIDIAGLQGGHSGMDIHKGLGNANKIMNRLLYHLALSHNLRIASIDGGGLRNAIPRESYARIVVDKAQTTSFEKEFKKLVTIIKAELHVQEPALSMNLKPKTVPKKVMGLGTQEKLLRLLYTLHNGVYAMSASIPDLVETSNNLARISVKKGKIKIGCLARSSVATAKMDLAAALVAAFELAGFEVRLDGDYPGWQPNIESPILALVSATYERLYAKSPRVIACHAGLECGILGKHYPKMDMVSFGPTIKGAHSPDERAQITSVQKFWAWLQAILADIPVA